MICACCPTNILPASVSLCITSAHLWGLDLPSSLFPPLPFFYFCAAASTFDSGSARRKPRTFRLPSRRSTAVRNGRAGRGTSSLAVLGWWEGKNAGAAPTKSMRCVMLHQDPTGSQQMWQHRIGLLFRCLRTSPACGNKGREPEPAAHCTLSFLLLGNRCSTVRISTQPFRSLEVGCRY